MHSIEWRWYDFLTILINVGFSKMNVKKLLSLTIYWLIETMYSWVLLMLNEICCSEEFNRFLWLSISYLLDIRWVTTWMLLLLRAIKGELLTCTYISTVDYWDQENHSFSHIISFDSARFIRWRLSKIHQKFYFSVISRKRFNQMKCWNFLEHPLISQLWPTHSMNAIEIPSA